MKPLLAAHLTLMVSDIGFKVKHNDYAMTAALRSLRL